MLSIPLLYILLQWSILDKFYYAHTTYVLTSTYWKTQDQQQEIDKLNKTKQTKLLYVLPLYGIHPTIMYWISNFGFTSQMHDQMYHHCKERGREYHFQLIQCHCNSLLKSPSLSTFSTLEHISLKKQDKSIKCHFTSGGKDLRITIKKSCCIKM